MTKNKYTIKDLRKRFGTEKQCLKYLFKQKYPSIRHCPQCHKYTK